MKNAIYVTDANVKEHGSGGGVVSFHELNALKRVCSVKNVYDHPVPTVLEKAFPDNPFMYDIVFASNIKDPSDIDVAQFYGGHFPMTMRLLSESGAKVVATVPVHNLEVNISEWTDPKYFEWFPHDIAGQQFCWNKPPAHLTDPGVSSLLCRGYTEIADVVICPSTNCVKYLSEKHGVNAVLIPHGTDLPEKWSSDRDSFRVFNLAPLTVDKGQKYIVKAWRDNLFNGELVFAGPKGVQILTTGMFNVRCLGEIDEKEKNSLYASSSVYVQSSVSEGFGIPILEAMSHGTPVIVTEGVGAKDCVDEGEDGFVVPIKDPRAIADKIRYFYDNPSEVKRMGINARAKAERYNWADIEKKYEELLKDV